MLLTYGVEIEIRRCLGGHVAVVITPTNQVTEEGEEVCLTIPEMDSLATFWKQERSTAVQMQKEAKNDI